jgi:hypothetical protein
VVHKQHPISTVVSIHKYFRLNQAEFNRQHEPNFQSVTGDSSTLKCNYTKYMQDSKTNINIDCEPKASYILDTQHRRVARLRQKLSFDANLP